MIVAVFDIEADGLLNEVTTIHCLSYQILNNGERVSKGSLVGKEAILNFFNTYKYVAGHNIVQYDIPVIEKIYDVSLSNELIDTLMISYYLYPYKKKPGLETYGEEFDLPKLEIQDWKTLSIEQYISRCERDVEINTLVLLKEFQYLISIYGNFDSIFPIISYLTFKAECLRDAAEVGITLDIEATKKYRDELEELFKDKTDKLSQLMPRNLGKVLKKRPTKMFKQDGSLSIKGEQWFAYLKANNLPANIEQHQDDPNPGSESQLKDWLFSLGWVPDYYEVSKSTGQEIPKVSLPFGQGITQSVKDLYEVEPGLEELDGYYKIRHRLGIFKSYLEAVDNEGKVYLSAPGLTNTHRLTHAKPLANLPKPTVFWGKEVRGVLTVPDNTYIMCGADVSGLEDNTKQHWIYPYDPDYVKEMQVPGFDPHVDIGVLAGLISKEEESFYKWADIQENLPSEEAKKFTKIKKNRGTAKQVNFSATYGAGGPKMASIAKVSVAEGNRLHKVYWTRNHAIKKVAANCTVKIVEHLETISFLQDTGEVDNKGKAIKVKVKKTFVKQQKWLLNPLSGFWLFLKAEKDRFSTLNQNSGVYVFDNWMRIVRQKLRPLGIKICFQYHDELLLYFKKEHKETVIQILKESMVEVNRKLNLNVTISISVDVGDNYADCH